MAGKLYLRGKIWWLRFHHNGQEIRKSCETTSREKAQARLDVELANARVFGVAEGNVTLAELMQDLFTYYRALDKQETARLAENQWMRTLQRFFGKAKAKDLTTAHFHKYRELRRKEGIKQSTIDQELAKVRRALKLAYEATPPKLARMPKVPMANVNNARQRFFTEAERERIFAAASREGLWARVFVEMLYHLGWRRGEVIRLQVQDINLADCTVKIDRTKNDDPREVPMPSRLALLVQQLIAGKPKDAPIFPIKYQSLSKPWERIMKAAGIENGHIHDFRRTSARSKRAAGVPEGVVMRIQGWRTAEMFRRYAITNQDDMRAAMELMDTRTKPAQS